MNAAVRRFLLYTLPTGAEVGMVEYSSTAQEIISMTPVTDFATRAWLADQVPLKHNGGTAIGRGLLAAKDVSMSSTIKLNFSVV